MTPSGVGPLEVREAGDRPAGLDAWVLSRLAGVLPDGNGQPESLEERYLRAFARRAAGPGETAAREHLRESVTLGPDGAPLVALAERQSLTELDLGLLAVAYSVEREPMVGRCIAYLQEPLGTSRPTTSLLSAMLTGSLDDDGAGDPPRNLIAAIAATGALRLGLIELLDEGKPLPERTVRMPPAVALTLAGGEMRWPGAVLELPSQAGRVVPPSVLAAAVAQAQALRSTPDSVLVLRCPSRYEARRVAEAISVANGARPLFVEDADKALSALGPVCALHGLIPVFTYDCGPGDQVRVPELPGYHGPRLVAAGVEGSFRSTSGAAATWTIPGPTREERARLWEAHLGDPALADRLAKDHVHRAGRIVELATVAKRHMVATGSEELTTEEVRQAAWRSEGSGLASLAQPLPARVTDEALIVRATTREQLDLLAQRCRAREELVAGLGATLQARYQMGVKALLLGPSGTGKTLAAGWLATKLSMPLYRVDMASITSKYIGETEKNLATLLGHAEQDEVMLLFDEADSLFGKRTDVKDANDRFANAQTNYLLQRIESYTGIVVLTSNSKARFDPAFTRRLDMVLHFPLPTPEERRAIWLSHLGEHHTLSGSDLNQIAVQCDFSGGHIRNTVLTAAVIAKANARKIGMEDVVRALADEYRKVGRQLAPELRGRLGEEER